MRRLRSRGAAPAGSCPTGTRSRARKRPRPARRVRRRPPGRLPDHVPRRAGSSRGGRPPRRRDPRHHPSVLAPPRPRPRRRWSDVRSHRVRAPASNCPSCGRPRRSASPRRAVRRRSPGGRRRRSRSHARRSAGLDQRATLRTAPMPVTTPQPTEPPAAAAVRWGIFTSSRRSDHGSFGEAGRHAVRAEAVRRSAVAACWSRP